MPSFWGPVTSSTEWCEKNYTHSPYIAEFYNTLSNVPCIFLALIGLTNALRQRFEKRFSVLHISNMILAFGSMLFHATLQKAQQQSDETPMVWEMLLYLYVLYSQDWHYRSTMPIFFFLYGIVFAVVHSQVHLGMAFKVHYAALCLLCIPRMYKYYVYTKDIAAKRIAQMYLGTLCFGGLFWLFDRMFCSKISLWYMNPQGHACWHILMGFNSYFENTFLMFCRARQLEWQPQVAYIFGFFPYVKIQKLKHQ